MCVSSPTSTSSTSELVPPAYDKGYPRTKDKVWGLVAGWFALYGIMLIPGSYLTADPSLCPPTQTHTCLRPDLFAFETVCISAFLYLAYLSYHSSSTTSSSSKTTPEGRLYGYKEESVNVATVFFAFQVWDFLISPAIPEFFTGVMMVHHVLAAVGGWFCLQHQHFHHYAAFFLGMSELSSIPLVLMTLSNYFPPPSTSVLRTTISAVAPLLFALSFGYFRVYRWLKVSYSLWKDCRYALTELKGGRKGEGISVSESFRPGQDWILYSTLGINFLLSGLQLYWFGIILGKVWEAVGY